MEPSALRVEISPDEGGRELYACGYRILELESCPPWARGLKFSSSRNSSDVRVVPPVGTWIQRIAKSFHPCPPFRELSLRVGR